MNKYTIIANEFKQRFSNALTGHLASKMNEILGCSEEEIKLIEVKYDISLPESYRAMLSVFGKTSKTLLCDLEMTCEYPMELTDFFYNEITIAEGEYIPPINVPLNMFAFASYLHENFYFFFLDGLSEDPPIYLANTYQGGGENFVYEKVGESIWSIIEESVKSCETRN